MGSEGTRGVSPGCGHGTPVLSGTSALGCRPLVDTLLGSAARGLYNYCIGPIHPTYIWGPWKTLFHVQYVSFSSFNPYFTPPFHVACVACHVILVQPPNLSLYWCCDRVIVISPISPHHAARTGQERCADTPSSGYTLIPGKQGSR